MPDESKKKSGWVTAAEVTIADEGSQQYIGRVQYGFGFKAMKKDVDQYKLWFPFNPLAEDGGKGKEEAQAAFKRAVVENGIELKKIETSFCFWMDTTDMLGRDTSKWKTNSMWWPSPLWSAAYKEVIVPSLEKHNIDPTKHEIYAKLSFVQDPSGRKKDGGFNDDGSKKPEVSIMTPFVEKVYANLQEALNDAGVASAETDVDTMKADILEIHREDPEMTCYAIGAIYSIPAKDVAELLSLTHDQVLDEIKAHADELRPEKVVDIATSYGIKVLEVTKLLK
jgi:hypothetical protein